MARYMGVDLGTSSVLIYVKGKGIVLDEPTAVAVNNETGELVEIGKDALMMLGKTPPGISVIKPMSEGVISKYEVTLTMLSQFIKKATAMISTTAQMQAQVRVAVQEQVPEQVQEQAPEQVQVQVQVLVLVLEQQHLPRQVILQTYSFG